MEKVESCWPLPQFADIVCGSAASKFGTVEFQIQANPAQGEHKRQPRLLCKLKAAQMLQGRNSRRVKRHGGDFHQAHAFFVKAVRTDHDLVEALSRKGRESQKLRECRGSCLILTSMRKLSSILPAFDRRTADDYFNQTYKESARDCQYLPPAGISRHHGTTVLGGQDGTTMGPRWGRDGVK